MGGDRTLRHSIAALALIRREEQGHTLWLSQWNQNWNAYAFVGGHKREEETFRECVIREIEEELHLKCGTDFEVEQCPTDHLQYTAWSESARQETGYDIQLFAVKLADSARYQIETELKNRWLSEDEINNLQTVDRQVVSPTMKMILKKAELPSRE